MKKIALVFPGQGSQSVGMLDGLTDFPAVLDCVKTANDVLNIDLLSMINNGPAESLNQTQWAQPALLAVSVGIYQTINAQQNIDVPVMAGHSLGEYSALVCAGALSFEAAIDLVHKRGLYMQEAVPAGSGAMAAVLGLDEARVSQACQDAEGSVSPANYNSPGQIVIAGAAEAVEQAGQLCVAAGAKKVMPLAVSVPSHCELMRPAAEQLAVDLKQIRWQKPACQILHNVDVQSHDEAEALQQALVAQLYSPVKWTQTMEAMQSMRIEAVAECGPGKVLSGLFKRFDRQLTVTPLLNSKGIMQILEGTS
ncbi:ACP S-malonyltransferase [Marinicella sediminis]|uniref:Malonyl CoA-acyl carrier protein transacylase n=1 Tax=Marinicella sediminis TaxID=1792834 RepID=A0ABV7J6F5_9GAMM|nr:ACP S-malonyltransferase [Marinicella sediminis]